MAPVVRHRVLTDWETFAASIEEVSEEPIIVDHLEAMAEVPGVFDSVFGNLARDLEAQPWLVDVGGYDWVTQRGAYRFAAEALNQSRVLNALGGQVDPDSAVHHFTTMAHPTHDLASKHRPVPGSEFDDAG